jgi:hypothetical protein
LLKKRKKTHNLCQAPTLPILLRKTENLKENMFNFETIIYLKSRAVRQAGNRCLQVKYILKNIVVVLVLVLYSCSNDNQFVENDNTTINKIGKSIPTIIDPTNDTLSFAKFVMGYHGNHYPMYFGSFKDTITICHSVFPTQPPHEPGTQNQKKIKGQFDKYFELVMNTKKVLRRDSANLFIYVDTNQQVSNNGRKAYPVFIKNNDTDTVGIGYGDHIPLILEAKIDNKSWVPLEERYIYDCAVGLNLYVLPPNEFVITSCLIYPKNTNNKNTLLRLSMGRNYSNEFIGSIRFETE